MQTSQPLLLAPRPVTILGSGHALPERVVTSTELDVELGLVASSVARITGHLPRSLKNDGQKGIKLQKAGAPARMRRFYFVQEGGVSELQLAE